MTNPELRPRLAPQHGQGRSLQLENHGSAHHLGDGVGVDCAVHDRDCLDRRDLTTLQRLNDSVVALFAASCSVVPPASVQYCTYCDVNTEVGECNFKTLFNTSGGTRALAAIHSGVTPTPTSPLTSIPGSDNAERTAAAPARMDCSSDIQRCKLGGLVMVGEAGSSGYHSRTDGVVVSICTNWCLGSQWVTCAGPQCRRSW